MTDFEKFVDEVKEGVKEHLSEEFKDAKIEIRENRKINAEYLGMNVNKEGQNIAPTINLTQLFEEFENHGDMNRVFDVISEQLETRPGEINLEVFTDYEQTKENLFVRVCNAETNKELLSVTPHERVGDLAMTYHVLLSKDDDGVASTLVTNEMVKNLGVSVDQLKADALENSPKLLPATLEPMSNIMTRMMGLAPQAPRQEAMLPNALETVSFRDEPMLVLSNAFAVNGASVIMYPEVMEQIGAQLGEDLFILPSSVHEVILVPDDGAMKRADLEDMVKSINNTEVSPKDRLSDTVYHYDSKEHKLERAVDFEERKTMEKSIAQKVEKSSIKDKLKSAEARVNEQVVRSTPAKAQAIE